MHDQVQKPLKPMPTTAEPTLADILRRSNNTEGRFKDKSSFLIIAIVVGVRTACSCTEMCLPLPFLACTRPHKQLPGAALPSSKPRGLCC